MWPSVNRGAFFLAPPGLRRQGEEKLSSSYGPCIISLEEVNSI